MSNKSMLYSLKVGAFLAKVIPRKIGMRITKYIGFLYGLFPSKTQARIIGIHKRLSPGLNSKQLRTRAANVVASYAQYWWDVFWMSSKRSESQVAAIIRIEGRNNFDSAVEISRASGVGIIVALPHMGSWEVAGSWLALNDFPPVVVAERLKPPELFDLFTRTRTTAGMTVIAHDDHPTSKLLAALKDGKAICLVADRDITRKGFEVEFFGSMKTMPTGPAALALKTGSVILPVCMYLDNSYNIEVCFYPPIQVEVDSEKGNRAEVVENTTKKLSGIFQEMISKDPSQWHVLHDEWSEDGRL